MAAVLDITCLVYGWSNISDDRNENVTVLLFGVQTGLEVKHISTFHS